MFIKIPSWLIIWELAKFNEFGGPITSRTLDCRGNLKFFRSGLLFTSVAKSGTNMLS